MNIALGHLLDTPRTRTIDGVQYFEHPQVAEMPELPVYAELDEMINTLPWSVKAQLLARTLFNHQILLSRRVNDESQGYTLYPILPKKLRNVAAEAIAEHELLIRSSIEAATGRPPLRTLTYATLGRFSFFDQLHTDSEEAQRSSGTIQLSQPKYIRSIYSNYAHTKFAPHAYLPLANPYQAAKNDDLLSFPGGAIFNDYCMHQGPSIQELDKPRLVIASKVYNPLA